MRPESKRNRSDSFTPKWRHFHPQSTLFMRNPFKEDIVFRVADEHDTPYTYRLPAGKICELPGGAVATLGLKEVVDKLISDKGTDVLRIFDPTTRKRYEEQVIVRVREAPQEASGTVGGEVNLVSSEEELEERDNTPVVTAEEQEFPGAKRHADRAAAETAHDTLPPPARTSKPSTSMRAGNGRSLDPALAGVAAASAGTKDQVIESD
jgi:hypothetical protein